MDQFEIKMTFEMQTCVLRNTLKCKFAFNEMQAGISNNSFLKYMICRNDKK